MIGPDGCLLRGFMAWTHHCTSSASRLVVSSIFGICVHFLSPSVLGDLWDSKSTLWRLLVHILKNRLLPGQPGNSRANPPSQRGMGLMCSSLSFLTGKITEELESFSHDVLLNIMLVLPRGEPCFFFLNDSVWTVFWVKCWPKLRSKKQELIMKWVYQGDGFSSGIELKKIKLFFKWKRQLFYF